MPPAPVPRAWPVAPRKWLHLLVLAGFWLLAGLAAAQPLQPVPPLATRVVDPGAVLDLAGRGRLETQLAMLEQETGAQVVVLVVATSAPEDIAAFAHRVADTWKLGRREVGDGVLLVVALQDRRIRIEVAKALEGALPDLAARRIITESITPAFRRGDTVGGLAAGIDRIGERIRAERLGLPSDAAPGGEADGGREGSEEEGLSWGMLVLFAFPIAARLLSGLLGRKLGAVATAGAAGALVGWTTGSLAIGLAAAVAAFVVALLLGAGATLRHAGRSASRHAPVIWGPPGGFGGGGWGGGGGSGGGGGFSSGGGGDFGGGGASGDW